MTEAGLKELHAKLVEYVRRHPMQGYRELSAALGVSKSHLSRIARRHGVNRGPSKKRYDSAALLARLEQ